MENNKYLTVKEVAEILGITRQAVYKRMNTDLSTYVVLVEKQKCLKQEVLRQFAVNYSTNSVEQSTELNALKKMVELLEKENENKQKMIERLEARNEEEHKQLMELTSAVGVTLQSITQGNLADKLIEGKKIVGGGVDPQADTPQQEKKGFFKKVFGKE